MQFTRRVRTLFGSLTGLVLLFLYLPLLVIAVLSFNTVSSLAWPPKGLTLRWWRAAVHSSGARDALFVSLKTAVGATVIALLLGLLASLAVHRFKFFGRESLNLMIVLPIALPGIVTGLALNAAFRQAGLDLGLLTLIIAHATFCIVVLYNNLLARFRRLSPNLEEASADLGAHTFQTFRYVTFPLLRTALLAGGLLAFGLSFDEIVVTTFTAGAGLETLPIWIFRNLSRGEQQPIVTVVATVVMLMSIIPVWVAQRLTSGDGPLTEGPAEPTPVAWSTMPWIYLVLAVVVLVVGVGVVLVNRRRAARGPSAAGEGPQEPPTGIPRVAPPAEAEPEAQVETPPPVTDVVVAERPTFRSRMSKARSALAGTLLGIRGRSGITQETWDELEEALLRADVGLRVTEDLLEGLRGKVKAKEISDPDQLLGALQAEMVGRLSGSDRTLHFDDSPGGPNVWLFVGVNGVGKTTTIGKVGAQQAAFGRSVLMAAGDTFRAAAAEQLTTWAERSGAELVRGNEGGDPSAVIFDAIERATARHIDLVLGDTAGRLHTKTNLMDELRKVRRVAAKGAGRVTEVLLVIDATTGQNGLAQAREFGDATMTDGVGVTGVVLTKLDGSAKGGIVFAIETEFGLPVKLVGLGESIDDLVEFDPEEFIDALVTED